MNIYVKLGLILAIVVASWRAVVCVSDEIDEGKAAAHKAGREAALLEVAQRDNKQLVAANAEIKRLRDLIVAQEDEHQQRLAELDEESTRRVADAESRKEKFVGDVVAGRIRLFDPGAKANAGCPGGGDGAGTTAVAAGGVGDAAGAGGLSQEFGTFLAARFGQADKLAEQVTYLQGYAIEAQRVCNAGVR